MPKGAIGYAGGGFAAGRGRAERQHRLRPRGNGARPRHPPGTVRQWRVRLNVGDLVGVAATERYGGSRIRDITTRATLAPDGRWLTWTTPAASTSKLSRLSFRNLACRHPGPPPGCRAHNRPPNSARRCTAEAAPVTPMRLENTYLDPLAATTILRIPIGPDDARYEADGSFECEDTGSDLHQLPAQ